MTVSPLARLKWDDVLPAIELVDTFEEIAEAVSDPAAFLQTLASTCVPVAIKLALRQLRPKIEPALEDRGLEWDDVLPVCSTLEPVPLTVRDRGRCGL